MKNGPPLITSLPDRKSISWRRLHRSHFRYGFEDMELQSKGAGSRQHPTRRALGNNGIGRVEEEF